MGEGVGGEEGEKVKGRGGVEGVKVQKKEVDGEKSKKVRESEEGEGSVVRVGTVQVSVRGEEKAGKKGEGVRAEGRKEDRLVRRSAGTINLETKSKLVRKYSSVKEDQKWVSNGLIGTVIGGESILLIQSRVEDAGFNDLDIIQLGTDKVFIHSLSEVHVSEVVGAAKQFFDLSFFQSGGLESSGVAISKGSLDSFVWDSATSME
jgi:hypothetical protein